ncbi:MAG: T9SS type A sorting domain-containing protein [Bacteroidota bacterium]
MSYKISLSFLLLVSVYFFSYMFGIPMACGNPHLQYISLPGNQDARFVAYLNNRLWVGGTNALCTNSFDFFLVSVNTSNGQYISHCLGTDTTDVCLGGTADEARGRLIMCGETRPSIENTDALILIADTSGEVVAQRQIGSPFLTESVKNAAIMSNGNIVFTGFISDFTGANNMWILCTDSLLQTRWQISFGGNGNDIANGLALDPADTIYVLGDSNSDGNGGYDAMLMKISPDGSVLWNNYYGNNVNNGTQGIFATDDGNWLIFGETDAPSGPPFNYWTRKVNPSGVQLWEREFGGVGADALFAGLLFQHQFFFTGYSSSAASGAPIDAVFCITDTLCNVIGEWQLGRNSIDIGFCITQKNNHIYFAGQSADGDDDDIFYGMYALPPQSIGATQKNSMAFFPYPNPAGNELIIPQGNTLFGLDDITGRDCTFLIDSVGDNKILLDNLPSGLYICRTKKGNHLIFHQHE